ncbi:unnamed protein product, partial [Callosobruchus maculatus]
VNSVGSSHILLLTFNTILTGTCCFYIILTTKNGHYLNIGSIIFLWLCTAMVLCYCGQKLTYSSTEFYNFLCNLSWYAWNKQNKSTYMILLMNSRKDMAYSCYGIRHIN